MCTNRGECRVTLTFETDGGELTVRDPIERRQYTLSSDTPLSPAAVSTDRFVFPVDDAVRIHASALELPSVVATYVRNDAGEMVAEAEHFAYQELPSGAYSIELCAPVKLYVRVEGALAVQADASTMTLSFDGETAVDVGGRSHHEQPAATITTTDDPRDVMAAVSMLGSALKTTTPERSYPTLRGHPPTIERGATLEIPPELERPETGVRIEVPPQLRYVYVVAPLAYYLGAEVVAGDRPRVVTDEGFTHELVSHRGFEHEVERVLKQTFFLDCVTRTEGLYTVDLHERRAVEDAVDLDFATLYEQSLPTQLETYLSVPYHVVREHVPEWKLTTHVAPNPENVEMLPFVVNDLAVVRTPDARPVDPSEVAVEAVSDFTRSAADTSANQPGLIKPAQTESLEQAWVGEDAPLGASKATTTAFKNKLERGASDGDIDITVVCNDPKMAEEGTVAEDVYGSRDELPFDVELHARLTTGELREVLESDIDFLHYVGHIDEEGFECEDGRLDARELSTVCVDAFMLNACTSYEQGMALIEAGSIGGVVTNSEVLDNEAVKVGKSMSRLLNKGFPLRAALTIAGDQSMIGSQYMVIGDGAFDIAQAGSGTAVLIKISEQNEEIFKVTHQTYPSSERGMGSMITSANNPSLQYLNSGELTTDVMDRDELESFLSISEMPLLVENSLVWPSSFLMKFRDRPS